jgi:hypothetical protein
MAVNDIVVELRGARSAYFHQKNSAKRRGVEWQFTFEDWCRVWLDSGKWDSRGRGGDKYCMARFGDVGPYCASNVEIIPFRRNSSDGRRDRSPASPHPTLGRGRGWTFARGGYQVTCNRVYIGRFQTQDAAEAAYRVASEAERHTGC